MPVPDNFDARDRAHVSIDKRRERAAYEFPSRGQRRKPLRDDYPAHAVQLLDQLARALGNVMPASERLNIEGLKPGTIVEVSTAAPPDGSRKTAVKVPTAIEFPAQDIVVLRSDRKDDKTESALLFVPDDARDFLRGRITEYGSADLGNRPRPDVNKFEVIETVAAARADALFVGTNTMADATVRWWELWIREPQVDAPGYANRVADLARNAGFDVHADRLVFPDTTVIFVHAAVADLSVFASRIRGVITEVRRATGTIAPFLERGEDHEVTQHDWIDDLAGRIRSPAADAPSVCVLDTGVSAAHPLIRPGLAGAWAYDAAWGADDHHHDGGHGTALVGLALYGDLDPLMNGAGNVELMHAAESMKLLPPGGFPATDPGNYGVVTQGAVSSVEAERPNIPRTFCIASSTTDFPSDRPSTWSGALDQIAAGSMTGDRKPEILAANHPKRLVMVATGNVQGGMLDDVLPCQMLEDPAQSWNALTVGGFTTKEQAPAGMKPAVAANNRSPYSRGSNIQPKDLTPIKPEVLFEAGNMAVDRSSFCAWHEDLSVLAAGSDVAQEPLVPFWATSAAAGFAGHFMGRLHAELPDRWPETLRALTVDSAQWPQPIRKQLIGRGAHWRSLAKGKLQEILREVGYGVPDIQRAMLSARNDVTMIAEAEIQPYALGADGRSGVFNDMHFYKLPWPKTALEALENEIVTMKVTLSYFIEPNLTGKAATRPETYRSFGLRFDMKKRGETSTHFRDRLAASQEHDETKAEKETSCWLLGPKAVQAGSLHCDLWRGRAIELASHNEIAVYPVGGWWKSHAGQRRTTDKARYSLVISISAPGHAVDLQAEVVNLVNAAEIETPIG
uniref:Peptidase S8/S53 domain-containing protein n=1 Tax=uncultured bacterium A1Q1_fos_75 TaxID=1256589 RepID=L7VUT7_9BACT|nr:hypothetical protein [uncultured bacterium A1Q1_fos_75]